MRGRALQFAGPIRPVVLAILGALVLAANLAGVCMLSRAPDRDLWIEIVSCSDDVLREVSDELLLQALVRTDADFTRGAVPRAAALLRATPGVLIFARELAFADSAMPFTTLDSTGKPITKFSDMPGKWQSSDTELEGRYFLGSPVPTCESLMRAQRLVVREVFRCCDTGRGPERGCILAVGELVVSAKAPPKAGELSPAKVVPDDMPADSPAERSGPAGPLRSR
jgi:hypothetical protein